MKLTFLIQQKLKLAIILFGVMAILLITNLLAKNNLDQFDRNFTSIYNDRLIPVKTVFYISQILHEKTYLFDQFFSEKKENAAIQLSQHLERSNNTIDSLLKKYEKNYFEDQEKARLSSLKLRLQQYKMMEDKILVCINSGSEDKARTLYEIEGKTITESVQNELQAIANLQSTIGSELIKDSRLSIIVSDYLLTIQIVIVIVIGVFIYSLLLSSRIINKKAEKYNLN